VSDAERDLAERVVSAMMSKDAFSQWLGITLLDVGPRAVTARLTVRDDMLNGFGVCHGGVTSRWLTAHWRSRQTRTGD
jgi:acyl-CoA thioesterase